MDFFYNYIVTESRSKRAVTCFVADVKECLVDMALAQHNVHASFGREYSKGLLSGYCFVECRIRKKEWERFESAMETLKQVVQRYGYDDYGTFCRDIRENFEKFTGGAFYWTAP